MFQWWYGHNAVWFFPDCRLPRHHVLFHPQARRAADLFLPPVDHSLLGSNLSLYLGRARITCTTLALPDWAQTLGMTFSIMLWMPSWGGMINGFDDAVGRLGQASHRSGAADARGVGRVLWGCRPSKADDVDQGGQFAEPLYRLDHRSRAFRRPGLGRFRFVRRAVLPWCPGCGIARGFTASSSSTGTSGSRPSASCSTSRRCGCPEFCRA